MLTPGCCRYIKSADQYTRDRCAVESGPHPNRLACRRGSLSHSRCGRRGGVWVLLAAPLQPLFFVLLFFVLLFFVLLFFVLHWFLVLGSSVIIGPPRKE